ncbi:MAG TPA: hypothetical protein DCX51_10800 [Halomonas sp.]|uniref:hypothetical protein n=1 Tax=Halomonadaceae TaxID=28256 RepID=UPI000E8C2092|nr:MULTISPECIES: hypothetical protein [Halomonas]HAY17414.1 hypothetical protein [Halomonas sp.]MCD1652677.1 hypothetical protein [Halomonas axialensis]MCD2089303.1 hypothetical protein [Halomonas meridiana]MCO7244471.1 hypothetical protein [Halomonas sp. Ps84H-12]HBP77972.1 hypothetical protein [Halomonas sp.]
MSKKQPQWDKPLERNNLNDDAVDRRDLPLKRLEGSVREYRQPFEPVGLSDWEAVMLKGLTPETAHADALASPTFKELGEEPNNQQ